eukprot:1922216-Rhodomonas_salina.1
MRSEDPGLTKAEVLHRRELGVRPATEPAGSASLERDEVVFGKTSRWGDERGELELFRQGPE